MLMEIKPTLIESYISNLTLLSCVYNTVECQGFRDRKLWTPDLTLEFIWIFTVITSVIYSLHKCTTH
jgi:hypothetical protein